MATKTERTELVPITKEFTALAQVSNLGDVIKANIGEQGISMFSLERIKVGSGESTAFTVTDELGTKQKPLIEFEAVLCSHKGQRGWWAQSMEQTGGGSPPDCSSTDLVHGYGFNGNAEGTVGEWKCASCPKNQWGSARPKNGAPQKGKDCREVKAVLLLRKGREQHIFPSLMIIPPGSLMAFQKYMTALCSQALPYYALLHKFSLVSSKSDGGITYPMLRIEVARRLEKEEMEALLTYAEKIGAAFGKAPPTMRQDDVEG